MSDQLIVDRDTDLISEATATFSPCRTWRYALTRRWDFATEGIAFVMLNPSTADAFTLDPTIRRCVAFAKAWGYGGLLVLNCFGLRSTDPKALKTHPDPVGLDNDAVIGEWLARLSGPVVAAWGVHGVYQDRGVQVAEMVRARGKQLLCLGATKAGHPRHPLYLASASRLVEWPGGDAG